MNWNFLSTLVTHRLGTSDSLTYVLPQSSTQNPVAVDSQGSFQSTIDESNRLPDGERQLSLVIREPLTMEEIARIRAEIIAQEAEMVVLQATGDLAAIQRGQTRLDDLRHLLTAQLGALRIRDQMAERARIRDLELANRRATEAEEIIGANARAREAEVRAAEVRAAEVRASKVRAAEVRAAEVRAAEATTVEVRTAETRASEAMAAEVRATEARAVEVRAVEARRADVRVAEARAAESRAAEAMAAEARAAEARAEARAAEARRAEAKAGEAQAAEARAVEARAVAARVAEAMAAEARALVRSMTAATLDEAPALSRIPEEDTRQPEPARAAPLTTVQTTEHAVQTTAHVSSELVITIRALADRLGQLEESFRAEQKLAAIRERTMLELIASFSASSSGGGGGRPTDQAESQAAGQTADQVRSQARDQAVQEGEEEAGEDAGEGGGEGGTANPTPAELREAGDCVGNDSRRNHQREGRYYCPVCGAYIRNLADARTREHFERCNIHSYQLMAEPPVARGKKRRREE